jgi:hypothetical protein
MHADRTSLIELGLIPDATGAWALGPRLDHTHSRAAHVALQRLIERPPANPEALRARQLLYPALANIAPLVPWNELHTVATAVEHFLQSNYVLVPRSPGPRMLFGARYRDIVTFVDASVRSVDALLALCETIYERIRALPDDAEFAAIVNALHACVRDPRRAHLRNTVAAGHTLTVAGLDAMIRGEATRKGVAASGTPSPNHANVNVGSMRHAIEELLSAITRFDAFCSLATASATMNGVLPHLEQRGNAQMILEGLWHPLLATGKPNDVRLAHNERVLIITGPNMAGKSTLLRAMGVAVYCAHLGMTVTARCAHIPWHDELMVSISARDNLQRGESLYLAEVRRVRVIVEAVERGRAVLAIFDEVFRGTNIKDATEATALLVDGLACAAHGTFVIASHLADVAESRKASAGVTCWCMEVITVDGTLHFTYKMQHGVSDVHLGMILLDAEGVGPALRRMASNGILRL